MNAAERLEVEEQAREREQQRRNSEAAHRRATPELVHKTIDDALVSKPVVVSPKTAPNETVIWWQWTDKRIAAQASRLKRDSDAQFKMLTQAAEMRSRKAATSAPGSDWCRSRCRRETARSSARYRDAAIGICAFCSCRPRGSSWSG